MKGKFISFIYLMEKKVVQKGKSMKVIRHVYLYLVTLIGLITFVMGAVGLINNGLQRYVFQIDQAGMYAQPMYPGYMDQCSSPYPDSKDLQGKVMITPTTQQVIDCRKAQDEQNKRSNDANFGRELSISLAQILIGLPIWLFHWGVIQKENRRRDDV